MKKYYIFISIIILLIISACSRNNYPEPLDYERGKLNNIEDAYKNAYYDFRSYDLTDIETDDLLDTFLNNNYVIDTKTKYPSDFSEAFKLPSVIENGKNPGLNIRDLHEKGITGNGVNVAIIDSKLLVNHKEFSDNIIQYEEISEIDGQAQYHGTPITSIFIGKNVGIAPEAKAYYVAYEAGRTEDDFERSWKDLARAIKQVVTINKELPEDEKIKVLSISSGWGKRDDERAALVYEAIDMAKEEGIFVVSARLYDTHGFFYYGLKRDEMHDPDDSTSYQLDFNPEAYQGMYQDDTKVLLAPMDARWLASAIGVQDYTMWRRGAWSIVVPYISGIYTLACQVKPDITPDEFWQIAYNTGIDLANSDDTTENMNIINPVQIIKELEKK